MPETGLAAGIVRILSLEPEPIHCLSFFSFFGSFLLFVFHSGKL